MKSTEDKAAWHRLRLKQEHRLAQQATDTIQRDVHLRLAALHQQALTTGLTQLLIVEDR